MHVQVMQWVQSWALPGPITVLDIGGRNVNGTARDIFPEAARYTSMDIRPGPGVDIVADAADWTPDRLYRVVLCTEVLEHTARWRDIVATAYAATEIGGRFIVTAAGPGRPAHSAITGEFKLEPGEHYQNICPVYLLESLIAAGFARAFVAQTERPADVRGVAWK